jgi:hypothetical protein
LSKRWFKEVARCHRSLAKLAVSAMGRLSGFLNLGLITIQTPTFHVRICVVIGAIAAAGRSGVEEMYSVLYLDVGCDVCCHVA